MHQGAVHSRHHREPEGLPDHHHELPEGGAGHEVPADCVHNLEGIRKIIIKLQEGERERGPPFTYLTDDWSSSVTEETLPEKKKEFERKIEIKEGREEDKLEEEEEVDKESRSK